MSIFETKETRKLFEKEEYTERELREFFQLKQVDSRKQENTSYIIIDGKISLINRR